MCEHEGHANYFRPVSISLCVGCSIETLSYSDLTSEKRKTVTESCYLLMSPDEL